MSSSEAGGARGEGRGRQGQTGSGGTVCPDCHEPMLTVSGCAFPYIEIPRPHSNKPIMRERIRYGAEDDRGLSAEVFAMVKRQLAEPGHQCGDCGARPGSYHHYGCDIERCPNCLSQLISCDCWPDGSTVIVARTATPPPDMPRGPKIEGP